MTPEEFAQQLPSPIPQVGAFLNLDSRLPIPDALMGNRHWVLAGSAALMAPDRVLTIGHLLDRRARSAIFFPYEGIFRLSDDWTREPQVFGDNLYLVGLERELRLTRPLPYWRTRSAYRHDEEATVCGYGQWPGANGAAPGEPEPAAGEPGIDALDGVQQIHRVRLGRQERSWDHYDQLDISWSREVNELTLGEANSGGPILRPDDEDVIGISRESGIDQQAGSWIGNDRKEWLDLYLGRHRRRRGRRVAPERRPPARSRCIWSGDEPWLFQLTAPPGTARVAATLNASRGLSLQMRLAPGEAEASEFEDLADDGRASGRFLYRELNSLGDGRQVTIAVAPVRRARRTSDWVIAQVCVQFLV